MSQDASTYPVSFDSFDSTESYDQADASDSSSFVDTYADGLMNELFEDVEQILDDGLELPTEPVRSAEPTTQTLTVPFVTLPPVLVSPRVSTLYNEPASAADLTTIQTETENARRRSRGLDYVLLGAACATFLLTAGIGVMNRQYLFPSAPTTSAPKPLTPEQLKAQADSEFLTYLERSLEVIDRKAEAQRSANGSATAVASANLPQVAVTGAAPNSPQTVGQLPGVPGQPPNVNVIERIYVPLYQPHAGATGSPFQNFALRYMNPPAGSASAPAPANTLPTVPLPSAPQVQPVAPSQQAAAPTTPQVIHTLVGILELGDRSAALFDMDGTTQRFFVGEPIGMSGWILVSVANQEAVIRRNGEVRSIYVGQKF